MIEKYKKIECLFFLLSKTGLSASRETKKMKEQSDDKDEESLANTILAGTAKAFEMMDSITNKVDDILNMVLPSIPGPAVRLHVDMVTSIHLHAPAPPSPGFGIPPDVIPTPFNPLGCFGHPTVGVITGLARAIVKMLFSLSIKTPPYSVYINGSPAAQCGDGGKSLRCCSQNIFEVALGSSSVYIDGDRAVRMGTDVTAHCGITLPKLPYMPDNLPKPPIPPVPMIPITGSVYAPGMIVASSPNVFIGGFPLPSFSAMLFGLAFKAILKIGKIALSGIKKLVKLVSNKALDLMITMVAKFMKSCPG